MTLPVVIGAGHVNRTHNAVLDECHRLLMNVSDRYGGDWKKVVQSFKKASLRHEGDEEARQTGMVKTHFRKQEVKSTISTRSQPSVATQAAMNAAASHGSMANTDPFGEEGGTMLPGDAMQGAATGGDEDEQTIPLPWYTFLAQNLCKVRAIMRMYVVVYFILVCW